MNPLHDIPDMPPVAQKPFCHENHLCGAALVVVGDHNRPFGRLEPVWVTAGPFLENKADYFRTMS